VTREPCAWGKYIPGISKSNEATGLRVKVGLDAKVGGADRDRTDDLLNAIQALSQLSYSPNSRGIAANASGASKFLAARGAFYRTAVRCRGAQAEDRQASQRERRVQSLAQTAEAEAAGLRRGHHRRASAAAGRAAGQVALHARAGEVALARISHNLSSRGRRVRLGCEGARSEADKGIVEPTSRRPNERNEADGPQSVSAAERV
jgi:hypothetical protein